MSTLKSESFGDIRTDLLSLSVDLEYVEGTTILGKLDWTFGGKQQLVTQINYSLLGKSSWPYSQCSTKSLMLIIVARCNSEGA